MNSVGIAKTSSSHRGTVADSTNTSDSTNGTNTSTDASCVTNSGHSRGGSDGNRSVGHSGLNGDRDLSTGSPWDLLGVGGADLTGDLGALLNRDLDGELDRDSNALLN